MILINLYRSIFELKVDQNFYLEHLSDVEYYQLLYLISIQPFTLVV